MYVENCQCARCDNVETCIRVDNDELVCADCCSVAEDREYNLDDGPVDSTFEGINRY